MTTSRLRDLAASDLDIAFARGHCPSVVDLRGWADGTVLTPGVVRTLRLWRGKHFEHADHLTASGYNRIGVGPVVIQRYRFVARAARSHFAERQVVQIDHDLDGNPAWVRRFHDEMVEVAPGLMLATSHQRRQGELHFAAHFGLDFGAAHGRPA